MDTRAPAVVAVVVTTDPGEWLEATLASLVAQDYEALSLLVIVNSGGDQVAHRINSVAPSAFVAHREHDDGFAGGINAALEMVEGAAFLLLCHDDVVVAPDAVHLLVEESFRSNAAIVTPKYVTAENASILLHVGQSIDRFGTIIERVQPGEFDQGQHDLVRDVFVAPGGVTLVREDLLRLLGGFDDSFEILGEDLDFCWKAQIAGARIVCAPQAVVSHLERRASGERTPQTPEGLEEAPTLQRLRRRNDLRTLLVCWGRFERSLTVVMLLVLDLGETVVAVLGRDTSRAVDIRESWREWWRQRKEIRKMRKQIQALRTTSDRVIRKNQTRGATRLRSFLSTLLHHGYDAARGAIPPEEAEDELPPTSSGFGGAFSDDEGFDELDDLGHRGRRNRRGRRRLSSARSMVALALAAIIVYIIGSRNLIGTRLPMVGQLVPLPSWTSLWHIVFASWQPTGLGNGAPGHPGFSALGLFSVLTLGHVSAAERILLLGAIPLGAWGVSRLIQPVASTRARLLAAVAFGGLSLGSNAISSGHLTGVVALGAMPFVIRRIFRLCRVTPFDEPFGPTVPIASRGWRQSRQGNVVSLALLLTVIAAFAPAVLVVVIVVTVGSSLAGVIVSPQRPFAGVGRVFGSIVLAVLLLAPLTIPTLISGFSGFSIFGVAGGPWSNPGIGGLLRFAVGPNGGGALAWLLPVAALVPLILARQRRLELSGHLVGAGIFALGFALFVSRGGWGAFAPDLIVVLAPLAVVIAALVGLGLAAFEDDLAHLGFGWRQIVGVLGVAVALLGLLPAIGSAGNGRWKMPTQGYSDSLTFLNGPASTGHRILWLGDPRAIPGGSWPLQAGVAWSTSTNGLPGSSNLFLPPSATASGAITTAIHQALNGETAHLGRLLAPAGVSAIVVVSTIAPTLPGVQTGVSVPPSPSLLPALDRQSDLVQIPGGGGATIYENPGAITQLASRSAPLSSSATASSLAAVTGWTAITQTSPMSGTIPSPQRTAFIGNAPASEWGVATTGTSSTRSAFGWAQSASVTPGKASLTLNALPLNALAGMAMVLAWIGIALVLLGRHRWLDWWWPAHRRRRTRQVRTDISEEERL